MTLWPLPRRTFVSRLAISCLLLANVHSSTRAQTQQSSDPNSILPSTPLSLGQSTAQTSPINRPTSQDLPSYAAPQTDALSTSTSTAASTLLGAPTPLSADAIFALMQEDPDVIVELKNLLTEIAAARGISMQPDTLSDEALYREIATNPDLRSSITTFLQARGYSTDDMAAVTPTDTTSTAAMPRAIAREPLSDPSTDQFADPLADPRGSLTDLNLSAETSSPARLATRPLQRRDDTARRPLAEPQVLHRPTPYNLLALRDLYTQLPESNTPLKRFGTDVFLRPSNTPSGNAGAGSQALDIPVGPDYVLGPGDTLTVSFWGGVSQDVQRTVDREGKLSLPEVGALQVAGLPLERAQALIAASLQRQFRDVQVSATLAHVRSVHIYVAGDVQRPGAYDISALSTPLNALFAAGGPTSIGSLRTLRHMRGTQLLAEIDLYDFLLHGVTTRQRLQSEDTLLIPPAGPQVAISGAVKRPAMYELKQERTLADLLADAGGATVAAELQHISVDRIAANKQRETISLPLTPAASSSAQTNAIANFAIQDGDRIRISPILPFSERVVYTEGHVVRPGRLPFHDGMQLSDLLHSYRDLLPEPAERAEILRLVPPDLHVEAIEFSVPDAMLGNVNPGLQPFDTIRIFGRYEADPPRVAIGGEVLRPGSYPFSTRMTAAQLVRLAGGFRRDALLTAADLTSYNVVGGTRVESQRSSISIGEAVNSDDRNADVVLKPGDVLTIHQLTGWGDIGSSITLEGEVAHPGIYGIQQGERLSSVLQRAGGLRETAYAPGAILIRDDVRRLEEKSREELIHQIEAASASARLSANLGGSDQGATLQLIEQQQSQVLSRLRSEPASGRLVIHITQDLTSWADTPDDIEVRAGDVLRVPKRPGFVLVSGQVYNASAITFTPGKSAGWYLRAAGGPSEVANKKQIFVIRANGSVIGRGSGSWLGGDVLSTRLDPGDVVVVPQRIIGSSMVWRNLLTVAQITSSIAITAAVAGVL